MLEFATVLLLALPLSVLAGLPHEAALRRRHSEHARNLTNTLHRRATAYKLVDTYDKSSFLK